MEPTIETLKREIERVRGLMQAGARADQAEGKPTRLASLQNMKAEIETAERALELTGREGETDQAWSLGRLRGFAA